VGLRAGLQKDRRDRRRLFEDCGGQIVQKIWPPLGAKDFGPFIPGIKADVDAVLSLMVGPMALQFPKQLRQSGFKKPIVAAAPATTNSRCRSWTTA